jgi:signal transduction histidine kinase
LLTNVVKYAHAKRAELRLLIKEGAIIIDVEDDGTGFNVDQIETAASEQKGFGLFSIRERLRYFGGEMRIRSAIGQGTRIRLTIPTET